MLDPNPPPRVRGQTSGGGRQTFKLKIEDADVDMAAKRASLDRIVKRAEAEESKMIAERERREAEEADEVAKKERAEANAAKAKYFEKVALKMGIVWRDKAMKAARRRKRAELRR